MSQPINLLLPELRPRFDWLALPVVGAAALCGLLLLVALSGLAALQGDSLRTREAALRGQLQGLQQQVQSLGQTLAARQPDASLDKRIAALRQAVAERKEVVATVAQGDGQAAGAGYSTVLQGFSRQVTNGVWLVGFGVAGRNVEIRGRLSDPALLPVYIGRLNDEPAFAGRRFAALDMKGVDPAREKQESGMPGAARAKAAVRYTEFALRTEAEASR